MRYIAATGTSRLALQTCLLVSLSLVVGCKDDSGMQDKAPKGTAPLTVQDWADPSGGRIDDLKAKLAEDPTNEQLLSQLGDVYFESRKFKEAIQVYQTASTVNPKNADVLNDLGLSYFYTGQQELALKSINRAVEADPAYKHAWLSMGFILLSSGRPAEAVAPLMKVKELDPGGQLEKTADEFLEKIEAGLDPKKGQG